MKTLISIALPALLLGAGIAAAQTVTITPEQQTVIHEYVIAHPVEPVPPPPGVSIAVGTALPDTIQLQPLDVPDVSYQYVVIDGQTVLVDPSTRRIVHVMQ